MAHSFGLAVRRQVTPTGRRANRAALPAGLRKTTSSNGENMTASGTMGLAAISLEGSWKSQPAQNYCLHGHALGPLARWMRIALANSSLLTQISNSVART